MEYIRKFDILGVRISAGDMGAVCKFISETIHEKTRAYICTCPVNTVMECLNDKEAFKSINLADVTTADGMPVAWLGRLKGFKDARKVSGSDLMLEVCRISEEQGFKNYFYGSTPVVLERLEKKLKTMFSNLKIAGSYSPPFYIEFKNEDKKIIDMINNSNSDILWVSLTSPKQDVWIFRHRDKLNVPVLIGIGAAFDFISGIKKRAPRWMQKIGIEWLFRFLCEPKRLWKRYLVNNVLFILLLLKEGSVIHFFPFCSLNKK